MNRRPVTFENSDDIRLDPYLENPSSTTSERQRNPNNCRENPSFSSNSRSRVNGLNICERCNKFRSKSIGTSHHICGLNPKSSTSTSPQPSQEEMDQPLNGGGQYRHFPPADEVGGDSSDILNSSSIGDDHLSRGRLVGSNNSNDNPTSRNSDIDNEAPEIDDDDDANENGPNVNEISSVYYMRRQQRRQQQRLRRRDTSSASVCGDAASRRRPPVSLSRSSTRIGQSSIPPPPSEPPPSLPPCGIDLSSQCSMYPVLGAGRFSLVGQQTSAALPAMLHIPGLPVNYPPPGGIVNLGDANHQLLQIQQAALLQQQLHQRIASVNATVTMGTQGNPYLQGFATVGRPVRTASPNQPQMTLLHHQPLQDLELISSAALLQAHAAAQAQSQNNVAPSAGGSGSVVYENSYNSFQRLPPGGRMVGQMPSAISQDLLSASVGGATNGDDIVNSTSSTTNGGGGVSGHPESLCKSPSVVAMASASSPSALVTTPLMNFYDASATSGRGNTYISHPHIGNTSARVGGKSTSGENGGSLNHISRFFCRCSWQYWVILICALAFLLAVSFAVFFSENAKWLENRLHEKYAQDPAIFGLFDPHNPPQKLESNTQAKIHLESMGLWAGHWHIQSDLCTIYNITLTSELASIGVFLRYSTMPTIVHYSHFDRILGRQLKADTVVKKDATDLPKEAFPSIPSAIHVKPNAPRTTGRVRCLKKGHWFISIVNDQPRTEDIVLSMAEIVMPRGCPNDCSNRGICSQGVCDCLNGLTGKDCSSVEDVPICSGHGEYRQGKCHCFSEWKGPECETLWSECPYPTCSGHGRCVTGECLCFDGFGGDACQFRICPPHNCSGNGICVDGVCRCFSSWGGNACDYREISDPSIGEIDFSSQSQQKDSSGNSPTPEPACSFNGHREPTTGHCHCFPGFEGTACEKDVTCASRCVNGVCTGDRRQLLSRGPALPGLLPAVTTLHDPAVCFCNDGWRGINCDVPTCNAKCLLNGQCVNDTCVCNRGWTGANCNLNECPLGCSGQGNCNQGEDGHHFCQCFANRKGSACQASYEIYCDDRRDDDQDGLIDCLDPDCCSTEHCEKLIRFQGNQQRVVEDARQSCAHSSEISALILSTKLSPPGSSFYDQLEFLLLRDLTTDKVDPRRVSVVRGVVRQWDSTPFWGCRVFDRLNPVIGSALTDKNGRFELVVDGGFLVQLEFIRHPTSRFTAQLDVYVPVNQIVNIGDFYLIDRSRFILSATSSSTPFKKRAFYDGAVTGVGGMLPASLIFGDLWIVGLLPSIDPISAVDFCPPDVHDISLLGGPKIEPKRGGDEDNDDGDDLVCFDSDGAVCVSRGGILFHSYALKPSRLHLVHSSDKTAKSSSFLVVRMLANDRAPPDRLNEVHLSVDVAGLQQSWRFEPVQGLEFTFVWNRTDGYNRSVYGTALARVSVGFLYRQCTAVLWEHRVVHIDGNDITPTDLAGWNLDARHTFAPNQGIVYMSDGRRVSVRDENLVVELILGKPNVRRLANRCEMCLGRARGNPIFRAAALATDETGRLLVSDGQFLRYLQEESHLQTLDSLNPSVNAPASITDSGSQSSSPSDWIVSDVRSMSFLNGGTGEEDWPAYFIARHPISSEELEALSRGGIGGGRAGIFISDARNRTIWWTSLARRDFSQMVISEQCSPNGTMSDCLRRSLTNPKGLVVTYNEDLFFIDDKQLWRYQLRNPPGQRSIRVELVIGQLGEVAVPMSCERSLPTNKVQLIDPSFMAYNPVEDSIYYVDDKHVFRLHLASRMVSLAAGRLPGCKPHTSSTIITTSTSSPTTSKAPFAVDVEFSEIRGIAFSSLGDLYIAESEVIWIRRSDGRLHLFAGSKFISAWDTPQITNSHLFRPVRKPLPYSQSALLTEHPALDFRFGNITSIAVGIFDEVFVSDVGHNVVFAVRPKPPRLGANEKYSIRRMASETQVFEKQGQLESVVDTLTQHRVSFFTFTGSGWLSAVRMGASDLSLRRSPLGFLQQLVLNTGETYNVTFALMNRGFGSIVTPFGSLNRYEYSDGGQMTKIWTISSALPYVASYSSTNSLLETIALPSGWLYPLQKTKGWKRGIDIFEDIKSRKVSMIFSPHTEVIKLTYSGGAQEVVLERLEPPSNSLDSMENHASWQIGRRIRMYVQLQSPENLLSPNGNSLSTVDNTSAQMPRIIENLMMATFDVFGVISQDVETGGHFARKRRSSWFSSRSATSPFLSRGQRDIATDSTVQKTRKTLSINGQPVLSVTLDRESRTETFRSPSSDRLLLQIVYNTNMQPTVFATQPLGALPHSGFVDVSTGFIANTSRVNIQEPLIAPLRIIYTREGQVKEAFWGSSNYRLSYDSRRRLRTAEIGSTLNTLVFDYQNPTLSHLLTEISVSGVGTYRLVYKHDPLTGENGLSHIITPLGLYRTFSLFTSLGVERLTFFPWALDAGSTNAAAFTFDWETRIPPSAAFHGYPLARFTWPSGRRVNQLWAKRLIVYDNVQIHWDREELTDSTSVRLQDAINEFQIDEKRQFSAGTLVTYVRGDLSLAGTRRVDSAGGRLLAYSYEYEYDQSFLVSGIRSCLFQSATASPLWCQPSHMIFNNWVGYSISPLGVNFFQEGLSTTLVWSQSGLQLNRRFDNSGRLLIVSLQQESKRQEVIINVTFEYSADGLLPSDMSLETIEDVPMRTHYRRGPGGRIEGIDCEVIGSSRRRHVQVVYNEESRVSDIRHYISDSQFAKAGNSESKHISTKFVYERGLLSGFGNWKYVFDENGCLIERRLRDSRSIEDLFEYNSKGLLRWVERRVMPSSIDEAQLKQKQKFVSDDPLCNGLESACYHQEIGLVMDYAVQFLYDAEDRLVVVRNTLAINDMIQFFYAHPQHRNRLTSFFHHGKGKAYFLTYEQKTGHLFAIEEVDLSVIGDSNSKRKLYIVITDVEGSPIALYADEKILWTAEYSATGGRRLINGGFLNASLLNDFTVPLGYRGALMDLHTGFLFHTPTWQAYDPIGVTLTSPDWRRVATSRLQRLHSHPQALDLHTWFSESSDLDPLARLQQAMQGPAWWLRGLDSGINRLFSHLQVETGAVSASSMEGEYNYLPTKCNQGLVITSRRLQQARHINDQLEQLGIVDTTRLASNKAFGAWFDAACPIARIKTTPPIFGVNVSFSLSSDGTISVSRSENNVSLIRIARVLFSGAKLMDSWYLPIPSHGGMAAVTSFVQLFVKVAPSLNTDLQTLQLQRSALLSQTPIRLGGSVSPLSGVMVSLDNSAGTELRISSAVSPGVEWRLRYEENWTVASGRVLQEARSRGIDGAQRRAALIAGNSVRGPRTSPKPWPPWLSTSAEMRQMESEGGVVKGFVWKPVIREPKRTAVLTELLDDPAIYQLRPVNEKSALNEN